MKLFEACYDNTMQLEALKQADYFRQCSYAGLPSFMFPGTHTIRRKIRFISFFIAKYYLFSLSIFEFIHR